MGGFLQDLKLGLRNLRKKPFFSATVIFMLALGVAGNALIFSVYDAVFLHALPFADSARLVDLDETAPRWNLPRVGVSNADFYSWRQSNFSFESIAAFRDLSFTLSIGGGAQRADAEQVTRDFLGVLHLQPLIGRNFSFDEDSPGGGRVVLLGYDFWRDAFQSDRTILGRVIKLDELPYTIIGVLPREAVFPRRTAVWIPLAADPNINSGYYLSAIGRLRAGISTAQARADLLRIHKAMIPAHRVNEITTPIITLLRDRYLGDLKTVGLALIGAVALVLLIACVNIAALLLVRGTSRSREIAIRAALGASRGRIVAQLLAENLILATIGGLCGILAAAAGLRTVAPLLAGKLPEWISFSLDVRFAAFCVAITASAVLLFGLLPSLQISRFDVRGAMHDSAVRGTSSRGQRATLGGLVVCELALALVLSVAAGLLLQAFRSVVRVDPGFRPEGVLTFSFTLPRATYPTAARQISFDRELLARFRDLPAVKSVGIATSLPLGGHWGHVFEAEGSRVIASPQENPAVQQVAATPGYFDAIGSTLLAGRTFGDRDDEPATPPVALVNQSFASHFWPDGPAIGKRIRHPGDREWTQVIGVLRDERHDGLDQPLSPAVFLPYAKTYAAADENDARSFRDVNVVLRSSSDPASLAAPAREIVARLDPDLPLYALQTLTQQLNGSLWTRRAYSWLFGAFATVALLLAAAGVYGTLSYAVSRRTREIGIRMAIGASPAQILVHTLRGGLSLVFIGIAAGLFGAFGAARLLRSLLFSVSSYDPLIYAAVVAAVLCVGLSANLVPALRAARVDPIRALRSE